MKRIKIIGLVLVAVFALSALATTWASAAAPEFGKCVAKAGGKYATAACTTEVAGKTKFEWTPTHENAGKKNITFTSAMKAGNVATLETKAGSKVTCTAEKTTGGEYTGLKTVGNVNVQFNGCTSSGLKCNSTNPLGGPEEIKTKTLEGELGVEKKGATKVADKIGLDLKAVGGGNVAEFECGGVKIIVKGSVIHNVKTNKMQATAAEIFKQKAGKQTPEMFEGQPKDILETSIAGGKFEQSGQEIEAEVTNEEQIEVNSVV
jgi:hypothetical protein